MYNPLPPLIGVRDGPEHAKRRRTWNRGFNPAAMKEYEPMVHKRVLELLEVIAQRGQVDFGEMFGCFTSVPSSTRSNPTLTLFQSGLTL
jgi:cytochrome P450